MTDDPFRADAALVYRRLRDFGPQTALQIVSACFPTVSEGPESSVLAIARRSYRRVYDSLVWMRHQGVPIWAVADALSGTLFSLTPISVSVQNVRPPTGDVRSDLPSVTSDSADVSSSGHGDAMDIWHGGS